MARLPPPLDFRYIGLAPYTPPASGRAAGAAAVLAVIGGLPQLGTALGTVLLGVAGLSLATCAVQLARRPWEVPRGAEPVAMGLFPYGVLLEDEARALRWTSVSGIHAASVHGSENGVATTIYSHVVVEVGEEGSRRLFAGRTHGAVPVEALTAHLAGYREEQGLPIALDLEGTRAADPTEPQVEVLLREAEAAMHDAAIASALDLAPRSYRGGAAATAGDTAAALRKILRGRELPEADPRPLATALAALLDVREVARDVARLATAPNPILAGLARVTATRLGAPLGQVGALEEVRPFLNPADHAALAALPTPRAEDEKAAVAAGAASRFV